MSIRHRVWNVLRLIGRNFPILGHLAYCTRKNHWDALKEFSINLLFGTATFWLTAVLLRAFLVHKESTYLDRLYLTSSTGQFFIFAVGMLGPILFAAADDPSTDRKFPGRPSHIAVLLIIGSIASGFYAMSLASRSGAPEQFDQQFLYGTSIAIAFAAIVMRYLTMVYKKNILTFDAEDQLKKPVADFADQFAKRHGGGDER